MYGSRVIGIGLRNELSIFIKISCTMSAVKEIEVRVEKETGVRYF
jgi:hypothetical protein